MIAAKRICSRALTDARVKEFPSLQIDSVILGTDGPNSASFAVMRIDDPSAVPHPAVLSPD